MARNYVILPFPVAYRRRIRRPRARSANQIAFCLLRVSGAGEALKRWPRRERIITTAYACDRRHTPYEYFGALGGVGRDSVGRTRRWRNGTVQPADARSMARRYIVMAASGVL
jgi:hypothetical protein